MAWQQWVFILISLLKLTEVTPWSCRCAGSWSISDPHISSCFQQAPWHVPSYGSDRSHGHTSTLQAFACVISTNIMLANAKPMAKPHINQAEGGREEFCWTIRELLLLTLFFILVYPSHIENTLIHIPRPSKVSFSHSIMFKVQDLVIYIRSKQLFFVQRPHNKKTGYLSSTHQRTEIEWQWDKNNTKNLHLKNEYFLQTDSCLRKYGRCKTFLCLMWFHLLVWLAMLFPIWLF